MNVKENDCGSCASLNHFRCLWQILECDGAPKHRGHQWLLYQSPVQFQRPRLAGERRRELLTTWCVDEKRPFCRQTSRLSLCFLQQNSSFRLSSNFVYHISFYFILRKLVLVLTAGYGYCRIRSHFPLEKKKGNEHFCECVVYIVLDVICRI